MLGIADDPSRLLVAVLSDPTDRAKLEPLLEQDWAPDALAIGSRVAYVWCSGGILESRLAQANETGERGGRQRPPGTGQRS